MFTDFARRASDFSNFYSAKVKFQFRFPWDRSIFELPAESCEEIEASEGRQAVNGNYWLDFTTSGNSTSARCDIKTKC